MKTGLESLDTGAPEITYSGNEGPKSPQQMQQMQQMQMAQLEEEYDAYVDDMLEQGIEPMSMQQFLEQIAAEAQMSSNEQGGMGDIPMEMDEGVGSMMQGPRTMAANGGMMVQGGVDNYLGEQKTVSDVPIKWKSRPGKPATELAYITKAEKDLLLKKDLHGSLKDGPNKGPGGIMSLDSAGGSWGSPGSGTGADSNNTPGPGDTGGEGGYNPSDNSTTQFGGGADNTGAYDDTAAKKQKEKEKRAEEARKQKAAAEKAAAEKAAAEKEKREKDAKEFFEKQNKKKKKGFFAKIFNKSKTSTRKAYLDNLKVTDPEAYAEMINELENLSGQTVPPSMGFKTPNLVSIKSVPPSKGFKETTFGDLSTVNTLGGQYGFGEGYDNYLKNRLDTGSGGGGGGGQQTQPATPPATPPPGGGLPDIPTDFVDLSGTSSYTNPAFGGQYFYGTPTITLANGGRANYAGGGIADLRQGYFLGKLVKKITKPFKKAFKGFKKIAKSPLGQIALMYFGGNLLQGNFAGSNPFTGGFKNPFKGNITNSISNFLSPNAVGAKDVVKGGNKVFPKLMDTGSNVVKQAVDPSGNFLTKAMGFAKEHPFAAITGISTLSGLYTDYVNNKRQDESMADYQRRLEIERGNFAPIPVDPVQFAANGGRMGFASGGMDDDDEDESIRSKALGALYQKLAMGGSAGLPPVTMQTEGQDTQSFGDDESTGMANATPTMQNQMPMRPPMMDPRMQQMMMAQRGNPMMNRGMMGMQQPRIMAQEGGMMDMGGMEKDYRNEGGFVPIGEYERKR